MGTKTLKGVMINPKKQEIKVVELKTTEKSMLNEYYRLLECDVIDIVERKIGNTYYDIIVDDEGLFKSIKVPSIITYSNKDVVEIIVNNVFIVKHDGEGGEKSLTDNQIKEVLDNIMAIKTEPLEQASVMGMGIYECDDEHIRKQTHPYITCVKANV